MSLVQYVLLCASILNYQNSTRPTKQCGNTPLKKSRHRHDDDDDDDDNDYDYYYYDNDNLIRNWI
jgi:hypothetical protein